jgi:hypothetical protein
MAIAIVMYHLESSRRALINEDGRRLTQETLQRDKQSPTLISDEGKQDFGIKE